MNSKRSYQFFISHPIQYFSPLFKKLAKTHKVEVNYYSTHGIKDRVVKGIGELPAWDIPLLDGYTSSFLKNHSLNPRINAFFGQVNLGVVNKVRKSSFDYIVIHGWNSLSNYLILISAFVFSKKVLLKAESPYNQEREKYKRSFLQKCKICFLKLFTFRLVHQFLYIGEQNKKFYQWLGVSDQRLIFSPYCIDNDRLFEVYDSLPNKNILKRRLGVSEVGMVYGFVGKLIHKKRPLSLIKAFISSSDPEDTLIIAGSGDLSTEMEALILNSGVQNIKMLGYKNQQELPYIYGAMDVFVLPSGIGETWGLVVNEAMTFDLPVIVSNVVGSAHDLVKENGYMFNCDDRLDLIKKMKLIKRVLADNDMVRKSSKEIVTNYSYDEIIRQLDIAHG